VPGIPDADGSLSQSGRLAATTPKNAAAAPYSGQVDFARARHFTQQVGRSLVIRGSSRIALAFTAAAWGTILAKAAWGERASARLGDLDR
jgi:hypothetical protein